MRWAAEVNGARLALKDRKANQERSSLVLKDRRTVIAKYKFVTFATMFCKVKCKLFAHWELYSICTFDCILQCYRENGRAP